MVTLGNSSSHNENLLKLYKFSDQVVDEFVSLLEQISRNVVLHHLMDPAVNWCRQNEPKQLQKTLQ